MAHIVGRNPLSLDEAAVVRAAVSELHPDSAVVLVFINQNTTDYIRMADSKAAILITLLSANLLVLVLVDVDVGAAAGVVAVVGELTAASGASASASAEAVGSKAFSSSPKTPERFCLLS